MKTSLNDTLGEFRDKKIEFGFVFNISPEPYGTLNYEVVANLNFFIFLELINLTFKSKYFFKLTIFKCNYIQTSNHNKRLMQQL